MLHDYMHSKGLKPNTQRIQVKLDVCSTNNKETASYGKGNLESNNIFFILLIIYLTSQINVKFHQIHLIIYDNQL